MAEIDHPERLGTEFKTGAAFLKDIKMNPDGAVYGEFETLDNRNGRELEALVKQLKRIGISSRGSGDVNETNKGSIVSDYEITAFDVVTTPSTKNAYVTLTESVNRGYYILEALDPTLEPKANDEPEQNQPLSDMRGIIDLCDDQQHEPTDQEQDYITDYYQQQEQAQEDSIYAASEKLQQRLQDERQATDELDAAIDHYHARTNNRG
nr:Putative sugar ABC transporter, substrate-binding protein [Moritella viscosa]